jgi:hypothetical protein
MKYYEHVLAKYGTKLGLEEYRNKFLRRNIMLKIHRYKESYIGTYDRFLAGWGTEAYTRTYFKENYNEAFKDLVSLVFIEPIFSRINFNPDQVFVFCEKCVIFTDENYKKYLSRSDENLTADYLIDENTLEGKILTILETFSEEEFPFISPGSIINYLGKKYETFFREKISKHSTIFYETPAFDLTSLLIEIHEVLLNLVKENILFTLPKYMFYFFHHDQHKFCLFYGKEASFIYFPFHYAHREIVVKNICQYLFLTEPNLEIEEMLSSEIDYDTRIGIPLTFYLYERQPFSNIIILEENPKIFATINIDQTKELKEIGLKID